MNHLLATKRLVLGLVLLTAACNSDPTGAPPTPTGSLTGAGYWAGSAVTVHVANTPVEAAVMLTLGELPIALSRVDDSTFTGTLPDTLHGGSYTPTLTVDGESMEQPDITVYGVTGVRHWGAGSGFTAGAHGFVRPVAYPLGGHGSVMIQSANGTAFFDLVTGTTHDRSGPKWDALPAPGATADPDVWIFRRGYSPPINEWWRIGAAPYSPELVHSEPWRSSNPGAMTELNPELVLAFTGQVGWYAEGRTGFAPPTSQPAAYCSATDAFVVSPQHDLSVVLTSGCQDGVPVFAANGTQAFSVGELHDVQGAGFSPDGSRLLMTGAATGTQQGILLLVNTASGQVVQQWAADRFGPSILFDPSRPLVYLVHYSGPAGKTLVLEVRETVGYTTIARMETTCSDNCSVPTAVLSDDDAVFVVATTGVSQDGLTAIRFALPPVGSLPGR